MLCYGGSSDTHGRQAIAWYAPTQAKHRWCNRPAERLAACCWLVALAAGTGSFSMPVEWACAWAELVGICAVEASATLHKPVAHSCCLHGAQHGGSTSRCCMSGAHPEVGVM